jgi:hypothetical protein
MQVSIVQDNAAKLPCALSQTWRKQNGLPADISGQDSRWDSQHSGHSRQEEKEPRTPSHNDSKDIHLHSDLPVEVVAPPAPPQRQHSIELTRSSRRPYSSTLAQLPEEFTVENPHSSSKTPSPLGQAPSIPQRQNSWTFQHNSTPSSLHHQDSYWSNVSSNSGPQMPRRQESNGSLDLQSQDSSFRGGSRVPSSCMAPCCPQRQESLSTLGSTDSLSLSCRSLPMDCNGVSSSSSYSSDPREIHVNPDDLYPNSSSASSLPPLPLPAVPPSVVAPKPQALQKQTSLPRIKRRNLALRDEQFMAAMNQKMADWYQQHQQQTAQQQKKFSVGVVVSPVHVQ